MKQTISNACGTIGALHAIANNQDKSTPGVSVFQQLVTIKTLVRVHFVRRNVKVVDVNFHKH